MTASKIDRYLKEQDISQFSLAKKVGMSEAAISSLLNGKLKMRAEEYFGKYRLSTSKSPSRYKIELN